jgi:hypothetical protein
MTYLATTDYHIGLLDLNYLSVFGSQSADRSLKDVEAPQVRAEITRLSTNSLSCLQTHNG